MEKETVKEKSLAKIFKELPMTVKLGLEKLSLAEQEAFAKEYKRKRKGNLGISLCWLFFGLHYGYMGQWGIQILYWLTLGGFAIWAIIDLFRLGGIIKRSNEDVAIEVFKNLKAVIS